MTPEEMGIFKKQIELKSYSVILFQNEFECLKMTLFSKMICSRDNLFEDFTNVDQEKFSYI